MASKRKTKHCAQDMIMHALAAQILLSHENGEDPELEEELVRQATRVGKMLGYVSWPGIYG